MKVVTNKLLLAILMGLSLSISVPAWTQDCDASGCRLRPDCVADALTEEQCDALEHTQGRGAVSDSNDVIKANWGVAEKAIPSNTERLMPVEKFIIWAKDETPLTGAEKVVYETRIIEDKTTIKLTDVVPALRFDTGSADIPDEFIEQLRSVLADMRNRANVRLHVIGHSDNQALSPSNRALYGDNVGLSEARAKLAAEFFQRSLALPAEAVSFEGRGAKEPIASNDSETGRAQNRRVAVEVWYDEISEKTVQEQNIKQEEISQLKVCRMVERCIYKRRVGNYKKVQLINAVEPLSYQGTQVEVDNVFVGQVARALNQVNDMQGVIVRVVGHSDNQPLTGGAKRIYGDKTQLSKALAGRIARVLQETFELSNEAVSHDGKGETAPLASNTTANGRALNRRIEVEIWHDDPRGAEVSEPRACPGAGDVEMVSVNYQDEKIIIPIKQGAPVYPNGFIARIQRILRTLETKPNVRINLVGHTTNERLTRRAAVIYNDHFGLAEARAKRVREYLLDQLEIDKDRVLYEGKGFLEPLNKPDDSPFARKTFDLGGQSKNAVNRADARVEVTFLYDASAEIEQDPNIEIIPIKQEEQIVSPFALHPIRISVDGQTPDASNRHGADVQRCTDVELENANVQMRVDTLNVNRRLNVQAVPATVGFWDDPDTRIMENKTRFAVYTNYRSFISHAEVRIYAEDQSLQSKPLETVQLDEDLFAEWWWIPEIKPFEGPVKKLSYVLRVYDEAGNYDQTIAKPLWVVNRIEDDSAFSQEAYEQEKLVIYGESHLQQENIDVSGSAITVTGQSVPLGHDAWTLGQQVPVSGNGKFVSEQIVPSGFNTIEVSILNEQGNGNLYLRDFQLDKKDWFFVGIADLTLGQDDTEGPAALVTQDDTHYESDFWADGRIAFYSKGKTENNWTITSSVDSGEEPLEELFSNLDKKDPDAIFRRLDPDYYYPTYGDDSTTIEDAPTSGKFYVKAEKNKSYAMWGNFKTQIVDTDLAQIDRALYGAAGHYESKELTDFGETKTSVDLFVAEPGTLLGRDEFRGTGGSLYFLQRRDITQGSERIRIEIRDRDTGIVVETRNLVFALDYDIDYIQGRILLNEALPSTVNNNLLVQDGSLSGNPVYLLVRYEYTPGFEDIEDTTQGARLSHWFNDMFRLGATYSGQEQLGETQELSGVDIIVRQTPGTYIKLESANTEGPGFAQSSSADGGFGFNSFQFGSAFDQSAAAQRLEAAVNLTDWFDNARGRVTLYTQDREAGFSAPGQLTNNDITQSGVTADVPIGDDWTIYGKLDSRDQDQGLATDSLEVDARYALNDNWRLSAGLRNDERQDNSLVVAPTQTQGERTDLAVEALYDSLDTWKLYAFVQSTLDVTDSREENNRSGVGGAVKLSDRMTLDAEASGGDGGTGGRLGLDYLATDRTSIYAGYLLDSDRSDTGVRGRNGRSTAGFRTRYSDSVSVYGEERYQFGDQPTGLTHAYGVDIAPSDRWTFGASAEMGTLEDEQNATSIERTAFGLQLGYNADLHNHSMSVETRADETDLFERDTTLMRYSAGIKLNPNWRASLKLNLSDSDNSQGEFYDGDFKEYVMGYAYRPVENDRLNMLFKYTFFENLPAPEQQTTTGTTAEFIQRSNIYSIDATYDITPRWTLGGKYAHRQGEVALDRTNPQFFASNANLYIVRVDWHIVRSWDVLVEGRALEVIEAEDSRSGFLAAGYYHLGNNVKVGAGYNFTDFSDDLTDLSFDSQGFFINIIGKM